MSVVVALPWPDLSVLSGEVNRMTQIYSEAYYGLSRWPSNSAALRIASSRPLTAANRRYRCVTMWSITCS
jgi:hypothetical protein